MKQKTFLKLVLVVLAVMVRLILLVLVPSVGAFQSLRRLPKKKVSAGRALLASGKWRLLPKTFFALLLLASSIAIAFRFGNAGAFSSNVLNPQDATPTPCITAVSGNYAEYCGPVMHGTVQVEIIFWDPTPFATPTVSPGTSPNELLIRFYIDVGSHGLYSMLTEYPDQSGSPTSNNGPLTIIATYVDRSPFPIRTPAGVLGTPTPDYVQTEIARVLNSQSSFTCHGNTTCYIVLHYGVGNWPGDGQYHDSFTYSTDGTKTIYGVDGSGNNNQNGSPSPTYCFGCDGAISLALHELFEAITDPYYPSGWVKYVCSNKFCREIADYCVGVYGTVTFVPLPNGTNLANTRWYPTVPPTADATPTPDYYIIQTIWDNQATPSPSPGGACSQGTQTP